MLSKTIKTKTLIRKTAILALQRKDLSFPFSQAMAQKASTLYMDIGLGRQRESRLRRRERERQRESTDELHRERETRRNRVRQCLKTEGELAPIKQLYVPM